MWRFLWTYRDNNHGIQVSKFGFSSTDGQEREGVMLKKDERHN